MSTDTPYDEVLDTMTNSVDAGLCTAKDAIRAAYVLGQFDGKLEMAQVGRRMVETNGEDCDHDWLYDGGDPSTGINPAWVCRTCDAVNVDMRPPSYDDDVI